MSEHATPEDIANVCKLLERLRTGELNLIPSVASVGERKEDAGTALLQRVEDVLYEHLRRMLEPADNGGPAFPRDHAHDGHNGMSLRDYFAAKALDGLVAENVPEGRYSTAYVLGDQRLDPAMNFARAAYKLADAMLKARQS